MGAKVRKKKETESKKKTFRATLFTFFRTFAPTFCDALIVKWI